MKVLFVIVILLDINASAPLLIAPPLVIDELPVNVLPSILAVPRLLSAPPKFAELLEKVLFTICAVPKFLIAPAELAELLVKVLLLMVKFETAALSIAPPNVVLPVNPLLANVLLLIMSD